MTEPQTATDWLIEMYARNEGDSENIREAVAIEVAAAVAAQRVRIAAAVEAAWTAHGAISQRVVLTIIRDEP